MKYHIYICFIIFFSVPIFSQFNYQVFTDSIDAQLTEEPGYMVSTINLEGNLHELVIAVGILDKTNSYDYPYFTNNNVNNPLLGAYEDGTLLKEAVASHGNHLSYEEWYGPAFNTYYNTQSGGIYTVDFDFVKPETGRYITSKSWNYYYQLNGNSAHRLILNKRLLIYNDICEVIYNQDPSIFDDIDCIHFTFEGFSLEEFSGGTYSGTIDNNVTIQGSDGTVYYSDKPVSIQLYMGSIIHERNHIIGKISNTPNGFYGFPDRGTNVGTIHRNMFYCYDIMYHNGFIIPTYSLFALAPLISHDLIFLGWIKPEEISEIDADNFSQYDLLKLTDMNYPLTTQQLADGYKRIIKVMIKENYLADRDEYFLIENHQATGFDKAFCNYDEGPPTGDYNKGILVWHVKETTNEINQGSDNFIDLEVAVPYDDWYGNPIIPPNPDPPDYIRPMNVCNMIYWDDNFAGDFDYLDDLYYCTDHIYPAD